MTLQDLAGSSTPDRSPLRSHNKRVHVVNTLSLAFRYVVPWTALCVAVYLFATSVTAAACTSDGSGAASNLWVLLLSNVNRTRAFAFIFGFLGAFYGIQQRNLRLKAVRRLKTRIAALEGSATARHSGSGPL